MNDLIFLYNEDTKERAESVLKEKGFTLLPTPEDNVNIGLCVLVSKKQYFHASSKNENFEITTNISDLETIPVRYFAKLDGDIVGIDNYIRFEEISDDLAQSFAEQQAEESYLQYADDAYDELQCDLFYAEVEKYDVEKHSSYFLQGEKGKGADWESLV